MAKKFKFEFERGGILIADACEEEAPVTVKLFEEHPPYYDPYALRQRVPRDYHR